MSKDKNMTEPIKLDVVRSETIHVASGENKIPSICFIVKDSEATTDLLSNPLPLPAMVITEVIPLKTNPTRAEILFRNLTAEEIAQQNLGLLNTGGSLKAMIGNLLSIIDGKPDEFEIQTSLTDLISPEGSQTPPVNPEDTPKEPQTPTVDSDESPVEEDLTGSKDDTTPISSDPTKTDENVDDVNKLVLDPSTFLKAGQDGVQDLLSKIRDAIPEIQPMFASENKNVYSIETTLAEAHLALMLCISSNSPAFVLTSEKMYATPASKTEVVWEDFLAVVDFPMLDTPEYFEATALLIQSVTGHYPLNITPDEIFKIRFEIISLVARIANGSRPALVDSFSLINPMNKTAVHAKQNIVPTKDDALNSFRETMINNLYRMTDVRNLEQFLTGAATVTVPFKPDDSIIADRILSENGLDSLFDEVMEEEYANNGFSLKPDANIQEMLEYYKARLTPSTLPKGLMPLADRYLNMPLLYDKDWVGKQIDGELTETNSGTVLVSKLLAIAVRFARLIEIAKRDEVTLIPYAVLIQGMLFPGEPAIWAYVEAIKSLITGKEDEGFVFDTLVTAGFPDNYNNPAEFLSTSLVAVAHRFVHFLVDNWELETLLPSLKETPLWIDLLNIVYEKAQSGDGTVRDQEEQGNCPVMAGFFSYMMTEQPATLLFANEFGQVIKIVTELSILRDTNIEQDTPEWDEAVVKFIHTQFDV